MLIHALAEQVFVNDGNGLETINVVGHPVQKVLNTLKHIARPRPGAFRSAGKHMVPAAGQANPGLATVGNKFEHISNITRIYK